MECLFCHLPPEECTGKAVNLLVGNCKPCHRPFPRQVTAQIPVGDQWQQCLHAQSLAMSISVMVRGRSCVDPGWSGGVSGFCKREPSAFEHSDWWLLVFRDPTERLPGCWSK